MTLENFIKSQNYYLLTMNNLSDKKKYEIKHKAKK